MKSTLLASALALAVISGAADKADARTIVTGGNVVVEVTYDLRSLGLWGTAAAGSPPATINAAGNPVIELPVMATMGDDYQYGSQVTDGGYSLWLNGGVYIFPLDADGNEITSFESTPEGEVRTCCRNALQYLRLDTAGNKMDGIVNLVLDRDGDGDWFDPMFTLGETTDEGTELVVTPYLAALLSYAYSPYNDSFTLRDDWVGKDLAFPNLAGQTVALIKEWSVETAEISTVPLPAALPLLGAGLGLMALVGRRKSRAA
ncbi:MAG: hypothetical protein ACK5MQ_06755 [Pikeienuella sp.]